MIAKGSCHCGAVTMKMTTPPAEIYECSCSICQKLGVLWAYYTRDDVEVLTGGDTTRVYTWNQHWIEFHTCSTCGCSTHWLPADSEVRSRMGVNARLIEGVEPGMIPVRHFDGGENNCFWIRADEG